MEREGGGWGAHKALATPLGMSSVWSWETVSEWGGRYEARGEAEARKTSPFLLLEPPPDSCKSLWLPGLSVPLGVSTLLPAHFLPSSCPDAGRWIHFQPLLILDPGSLPWRTGPDLLCLAQPRPPTASSNGGLQGEVGEGT